MRVLFTEEMRLYLELKWMAKPSYKPQRSLNVVFPRRRCQHGVAHGPDDRWWGGAFVVATIAGLLGGRHGELG
jgi:hypothetical protein